MNRRSFVNLGAAALVVSTGLGLNGMALAETAATPIEITDMAEGSPDAPVTVIEYSSFTCPHCADFHAEQYKQMKADFIDTGKVRFVYREVYFDRPGLWAGMIARCGGEMRYFGIIGMIFDKQRDWIGDGKGETIAANLRKIGLSAGLTEDELDTCLADGDTAQAMIDHYEANLKEYDIKGTPSVVVNGTLHGNMAYSKLKEIIEAELAK